MPQNEEGYFAVLSRSTSTPKVQGVQAMLSTHLELQAALPLRTSSIVTLKPLMKVRKSTGVSM